METHAILTTIHHHPSQLRMIPALAGDQIAITRTASTAEGLTDDAAK